MNKVCLLCILFLLNGGIRCSEGLPDMQLAPVCPDPPQEEIKFNSELPGLEPPLPSSALNWKTCDLCNKNIRIAEYTLHRTNHKEQLQDIHSCQASPSCLVKFSGLELLAHHHNTDHNRGRKIRCKCNRWLGVSTYRKHQNSKTCPRGGKPRRIKMETCTTCNMSFQKGTGKRKHTDTHTGEYITCDWFGCSFASDSTQTMQRHRKEIHNTTTTHWCKCRECNGKFIARSTFFRHKEKKKR